VGGACFEVQVTDVAIASGGFSRSAVAGQLGMKIRKKLWDVRE